MNRSEYIRRRAEIVTESMKYWDVVAMTGYTYRVSPNDVNKFFSGDEPVRWELVRKGSSIRAAGRYNTEVVRPYRDKVEKRVRELTHALARELGLEKEMGRLVSYPVYHEDEPVETERIERAVDAIFSLDSNTGMVSILVTKDKGEKYAYWESWQIDQIPDTAIWEMYPNGFQWSVSWKLLSDD